MLVLSRHAGEIINIAQGKIKVSILSIHKSNVTVGIEAPKEIEIRREEAKQKKAVKLKDFLCKR